MKKPQLFFLHFAGGNRYSFRFMDQLLLKFNVIPLELPGRGKRSKENLITDFELASSDLFCQLKKHLTDEPFLLYGHSMGASMALKITQLLENIGLTPMRIIVSGNPGPGVMKNRKRYLLEHNEFVDEIKKLGGLPDEVIENKEILEFYLPVLRADFEIAENHGLENMDPVNAPILAIMGSKEENVAEIGNWKRFTKNDFDCKVLEGNHFFIYDYPHELAEFLNKSVAS